MIEWAIFAPNGSGWLGSAICQNFVLIQLDWMVHPVSLKKSVNQSALLSWKIYGESPQHWWCYRHRNIAIINADGGGNWQIHSDCCLCPTRIFQIHHENRCTWGSRYPQSLYWSPAAPWPTPTPSETYSDIQQGRSPHRNGMICLFDQIWLKTEDSKAAVGKDMLGIIKSTRTRSMYLLDGG